MCDSLKERGSDKQYFGEMGLVWTRFRREKATEVVGNVLFLQSEAEHAMKCWGSINEIHMADDINPA